MDDAQRYYKMMEELKAKVSKSKEASSFDFITSESLLAVSQEVVVLVAVSTIFFIFVFVFLSRPSSRRRLLKIRKTFFVPPSWFGIASGICAWQSLNALTTVVIFIKTASSGPIGSGIASTDYFNWGMFSIAMLTIFGFAVSLGAEIDLGYAVLMCMFSAVASFVQAAMVTESLAIAGYLGLANCLFALYWGVGIGKGWFKAEMHQAMREMEGWGVSKETTNAISAKMGSGRRGKRPAVPPKP